MVHLLVFAAANGTTKAGKAIALALGIGLGSLGAGVGIGNIFLAVLAVPAATLFYLFEVIIVVSIQAYIFAALSAIYIGSAIEPEH